MKVELLTDPDALKDSLRIIEIAGRTCYDSENKGDADGFIRRLIRSGHESVIEHGIATFKISGVSRALTHQLVRHRIASYSQRSQRYVNEDGFSYVLPESIEKNDEARDWFKDIMKYSNRLYRHFVDLGISKEDARMVLPNACHTEIVMTANFREWRHIIKLRSKSNAQWEIRKVATIIRDILLEHVPVIVEDL